MESALRSAFLFERIEHGDKVEPSLARILRTKWIHTKEKIK